MSILDRTPIPPRREMTTYDRNEYHVYYWGRARRWAIKKYGTDTRLTWDDLIDISDDAVLRALDKADRNIEEGTPVSGALFWFLVTSNISQRIIDEWARLRTRTSHHTYDEAGDEDGLQPWWMLRTELCVHSRESLLHHKIAAQLAILPTRWKILLTLRYYEELPLEEVAKAVSAHPSKVKELIGRICAYVLMLAMQEVPDQPPAVEPARTNPWEIPFTMHRWVWLNTKYPDVHTWLGAAQHAYETDVSYLVDFLDRAHGKKAEFGKRADWEKRDRPVIDCGTASGYRKHKREHTEPCEPCRQANRIYRHAEHLRRTGRGTAA